jgi:hypothetical protein
MRIDFRRRTPLGFAPPYFHGSRHGACAGSLPRLGDVLTVPFDGQTHLIEMRGNGTTRLCRSSTRNADELWPLAYAAPMIRPCRNVIETTRTDRRARRASGSASHCKISCPSSDAAGQSRLTARKLKRRPEPPLNALNLRARVFYTFNLTLLYRALDKLP